MNKFYVQVWELMKENNYPLDLVFENIKAGRLKIYLKNGFDYDAIGFDSCINNFISNTFTEFENKINLASNNYYKLKLEYSRYERFEPYCFERVDYSGIKNALERAKKDMNWHRSQKNIFENELNTNRTTYEKKAILGVYVKREEIETLSDNRHSRPRGRGKDNERIEITMQGCRDVFNLYRDTLKTKTKEEVKNLVKDEIGQTPHTATFNELYRDCEFTRSAGNPHLKKNAK